MMPKVRSVQAHLCSTKIMEPAMAAVPIILVADVVWRDVPMCNRQLGQLLHGISNVKSDLRDLLHRQACFKRLDYWLHQHSLPEGPAVMEIPSCQEAHEVGIPWQQL